MKILITGAHGHTGRKGFIGSWMYKYLKEKELDVYRSYKDLRVYENALHETKGMSWIFSFSANMGGIGYFNKQNYYPPIDNYLIDLNILRACEENKVKRLFYPSSACAYPMRLMDAGIPLQEDMLKCHAQPDKMYGWEKLSMVKLMKESPVDCRVGVLHTVYGEGQEYKGERAKFPPQIAYKALQAVKTGEIEVWGDGTQTRTFLYIKDAIQKIYDVMASDEYYGEVNIGSDKEVSINNVVKLCCNILHIKPKIKYNKRKPVGPTRRLCDNTKFNEHYGMLKETSLKKGFTNLINYIKKHELLSG
jgi:nucleoside-diphosphate-sugar epimerase